MIRKIFKVGECPFRPGVEVGSTVCRTCADYKGEPAYCSFVICSHEGEIATGGESQQIPKPKAKRGRPPGKAKKKPVNGKTKSK